MIPRPAACLMTMLAAAPALAQAPDPLSRIGHIVVIYEENRSFDNLFGHFPGADNLDNAGAAATQVDASGTPYATLPPVLDTNLRPAVIDMRFPAAIPNGPFDTEQYVPQNVNTGDLVHRFYIEQYQINGGAMNRFAVASDAGGLVMSTYDLSKTYAWQLAREYTLSDRYFHAGFGGSFLNHSFLACACVFVWPHPDPKNVTVFAAPGQLWPLKLDGRTTPVDPVSGSAAIINTTRSIYLHAPGDDPATLAPPQHMAHLGDLLDAHRVDWAYYGSGYRAALAWQQDPSGPVKGDPLFQYHHHPFAYFADLAPGTPGNARHMKDLPDFLADIDAGTLPPVAFYKPIGEVNLHPGYTNITDGDNHLREIVGRLQAGPQYADMLILITFDEHGGLWDHVAPPKRDQWGPGTRVPLIAVGPTVRRGFVDHTSYDTISILRTIEQRFGLGTLYPNNGGAAAGYPNNGSGGIDDGLATVMRSFLQ